jgi:hypothetical protein
MLMFMWNTCHISDAQHKSLSDDFWIPCNLILCISIQHDITSEVIDTSLTSATSHDLLFWFVTRGDSDIILCTSSTSSLNVVCMSWINKTVLALFDLKTGTSQHQSNIHEWQILYCMWIVHYICENKWMQCMQFKSNIRAMITHRLYKRQIL